MVELTALWIPIFVSAVLVFVASSIMHMVLPYHKSDYAKLPDEEKVMDAIRAAGVTPGFYHFPRCESHKDMKSPEYVAKMNKGPIGLLTVIPSGQPNMGKYLGIWFAYLVVVSIFVAYLTGRVVAPGTEYLHVFRVAGTVAFMAYAVGQSHASIWEGRPWGNTLKSWFDGLIFACLTAGVFGWRWPKM